MSSSFRSLKLLKLVLRVKTPLEYLIWKLAIDWLSPVLVVLWLCNLQKLCDLHPLHFGNLESSLSPEHGKSIFWAKLRPQRQLATVPELLYKIICSQKVKKFLTCSGQCSSFACWSALPGCPHRECDLGPCGGGPVWKRGYQHIAYWYIWIFQTCKQTGF